MERWSLCRRNIGRAMGALLLAMPGVTANAEELGTGFAYHGRLTDEASPFDGTVDLIFELWDSDVAGVQVGDPVEALGVPVSDGSFSVEINKANEFGGDAFRGDARWLRIQVRDAAVGGAYEPLAPRQKVTAVPYALYAKDAAEGAGMSFWQANAEGIDYGGGYVGIGTTTPVAPLDVAGTARAQSFSVPNPNNSGATVNLTWLNDVARIRYGGNGAGAGGGLDIQGTGDVSKLRILDNGSVGIGTSAPSAKLDVRNGAIRSHRSAVPDQYIQMHSTSPSGHFLITNSPESNKKNLVIQNRHDGSGSPSASTDIIFQVGNVTAPVEALRMKESGRVGIGTSSPQGLLHVRGAGTALGEHVAVFENTSTNNGDGVAIKINQLHTNRSNNFVTFLNSSNQVRGRIEGFDLESGDWFDPPPIPSFNLDIDTGISPRDPSLWFDIGEFNLNLQGIRPEPEFCDVFGFDVMCNVDIVWDPPPDVRPPSITSSPLNFGEPSIDFTLPTPEQVEALLCWAFENDVDSLVTLDPLTQYTEALRLAAAPFCLDEGVIYGSKGADYAEYLEKLYPDEPLRSSYVVGVFGGKITRYTEGAEQVMVISSAPVVVGNMPNDEDRERYAKVAFMGQVPVVTRGEVHSGDYLVPSGRHDGSAIAVAPKDLTVDDVAQVIGRAWSESTVEFGMVNIVVGVRDEAAAHVLRRQKEQLERQAASIAALERQMRMVASRVGVAVEE